MAGVGGGVAGVDATTFAAMLRASDGVIKPMIVETIPEAIASDNQTRQDLKAFVTACLYEIMQTRCTGRPTTPRGLGTSQTTSRR